ncbi:uncharacterized protein [Malus domestica]|uniref:uncharacterized protein n=1 Tax=Malus domestica TaxID=3750 RepID=UPI000498ABC8
MLNLPLDQEKSNHLFNVKKNSNESLRDYVKRFKVEKEKIVGCDNSIISIHFGTKLDKQTKCPSSLEKSRQWLKRRRMGSSPTKAGRRPNITPNNTHSTEVLNTTDDCYTWKNYLEKLVKEGKVDKCLNKLAVHPRRNADDDKEPSTKAIRINGIFAESEHLGATNNSKKMKIQQVLLVSHVQTTDTQPGTIIGFIEQDAEDVDYPHDDILVVSVQLAYAIVDRMMVDNGSVVNLLQLSVIQKMGLESTIIRRAEVLTGFNRHTSTTIGHIALDVKTPPVVSK